MELCKLLNYHFKTTGIPLSLFTHTQCVERFRTHQFEPYLDSYYAALHIPHVKNTDMHVTDQHLVFGYVRKDATDHCAVIGPVLAYRATDSMARDILYSLGEDEERKAELLAYLKKLPVIHLPKIRQHIYYLNYIVNGEEPPDDIPNREIESLFSPHISDEDCDDLFVHNSEDSEKIMFSLIEHGKTKELAEMLDNLTNIDSDEGIVANDFLRSKKNIFVVSAALVSRAAIKGGLDYETAMTLSDSYLQKMELLDDYDTVHNLMLNMILDFASIVQKRRQLCANSRIVSMACNYVANRLYNRITVGQIAQELRVNKTYLSSHFKKHTGVSLAQYINEQKVTEAKFLLTSTNKTIIEISELLNFSSQSYFQTVFVKTTGTTPNSYRNAEKFI